MSSIIKDETDNSLHTDAR